MINDARPPSSHHEPNVDARPHNWNKRNQLLLHLYATTKEGNNEKSKDRPTLPRAHTIWPVPVTIFGSTLIMA